MNRSELVNYLTLKLNIKVGNQRICSHISGQTFHATIMVDEVQTARLMPY